MNFKELNALLKIAAVQGHPIADANPGMATVLHNGFVFVWIKEIRPNIEHGWAKFGDGDVLYSAHGFVHGAQSQEAARRLWMLADKVSSKIQYYSDKDALAAVAAPYVLKALACSA